MEISLIQGEIKVFTFTFDVDVSSATFTLIIKDAKSDIKITKADGDFDKTDIADKILKVTIDTSALSVGTNYMELKTVWSATSVDKTEKHIINITEILFD